jgi:hypothetical protein
MARKVNQHSQDPTHKKGNDPKSIRTKAGKVRMIKAMLQDHVFTIRKACEVADVDFTTHYAWIKEDESYKDAIAAATEQQVQRLEQAANERAAGIGVKQPSDILTIFLLNAKRPDVYRPKTKIEHSGGISIKELLLTDEEQAK